MYINHCRRYCLTCAVPAQYCRGSYWVHAVYLHMPPTTCTNNTRRVAILTASDGSAHNREDGMETRKISRRAATDEIKPQTRQPKTLSRRSPPSLRPIQNRQTRPRTRPKGAAPASSSVTALQQPKKAVAARPAGSPAAADWPISPASALSLGCRPNQLFLPCFEIKNEETRDETPRTVEDVTRKIK